MKPPLKLVIIITQDDEDLDHLNHIGLGIMDDIMSFPRTSGTTFSSYTITDADDGLVCRTDREEAISRDADGELYADQYTGRRRKAIQEGTPTKDA
jgi:hypothetical protein